MPDATQTPPEISRAATLDNALPLDRLALLGTFGTEGQMRALFRLPSGRIRGVAPGDRIKGARVAAVAAGHVILERGGETEAFALPDLPDLPETGNNPPQG